MRLPKDLPGVAKFILSPQCKSICILSGAGVSVASGIPDFRSPGGLYDTLRPDLITATEDDRALMAFDASYVVEKNMFLRNSFPYLEVRRPFILGTQQRQWKATIAHRFMELLYSKINKLTRVYSQNIDGLDRQCKSVPAKKIVNVHGTLGEVACEACGEGMDFNDFCLLVKSNIKDIYNTGCKAPSESTPIKCKSCGRATVKPNTVLFGASLPSEFYSLSEADMPKVDLLIIAGTSLVVSPANLLVIQAAADSLRLIVNMNPVGSELGIKYGAGNTRDFFVQGSCEEIFLDLIEELGWLHDLNNFIDDLPDSSANLVRSRMAKS